MLLITNVVASCGHPLRLQTRRPWGWHDLWWARSVYGAVGGVIGCNIATGQRAILCGHAPPVSCRQLAQAPGHHRLHPVR